LPLIFPPISPTGDNSALANLLSTLPAAQPQTVNGPSIADSPLSQSQTGILGNVNAQPAAPAQPATALPRIADIPLGAMTRTPNPPSKLDVMESQDSNKLAADQYKDAHPWGSPDNHPGFWGKVGHIAGKIGNIAGDALVPNIMAETPGTDLNRFLEEKGLQSNIQGIEKQQSEQSLQDAQTQNLQSETAARDAATASKPGEEWSVVPGAQGPHGEPIEVEKGSGNMRIGSVPGGVTTAPKPGQETLGASADQLNQINTARYQVLHPGEPLPAAFKLTPQSTQKDTDRIEKGLQGVEGAEATQEQRKQTETLRQQNAQAAAQARADRQAASETKTDAATRKEVLTLYTPALDAAKRLNVMSEAGEKAKQGDQQAGLAVLTNHLGMTAGGQKGMRITQAMLQEAQQSRPWLAGVKAKFDKDGYLTGVTLTPQQVDQMVALGRTQLRESTTEARSGASYVAPGRSDDGPERIPSTSTMHLYLKEANGDIAKAKQLAKEEGWSVN
jgi:hypothetical protein